MPDAIGQTFCVGKVDLGRGMRTIQFVPPANAHGPILVVEDDSDIRETVRDLLVEAGYAVAEARDGREALRHLAEALALPCVVLLDLMMPGVSGDQVLAEMKQHAQLREVPVVITTASPERPPGAVAYLKKPFGADALLQTVRHYC